MAKADRAFLVELKAAVDYIAEYTFEIYIYMHSEDPNYLKIVQTLLSWLGRTMDPIYGYPPDTTDWDIDTLCHWLSSHNVPIDGQIIPSEYRNLYTNCMEPMRPSGTIKRRSPYHINDADTAQQQLVRKIFLSATDCFQAQLKYHEITNPDLGFKSRGQWYNASLGSGLFYYTYFMRETLNIMFGPLIHDKYPFAFRQTPNWCKVCNRCEVWKYTPMGPDDFIFSIHEKPLPATSYFYNFNIKAEPDPTSPTPGDPNVLKIILGVQGLNSEDEPTGLLHTAVLDPISTNWTAGFFAFDAGPNTAKIYLSIQPRNGAGDYLLYFRNSQVETGLHDLMYMIYGAEGNPFGWEVGAGDFSFKEFADA